MEVVRDEMSMIRYFTSTIEKNSQFVRVENGLSKIIVDNDFWEEAKYQMFLMREIEKGDESIRNGKTHTRADFQKKYGLVK